LVCCFRIFLLCCYSNTAVHLPSQHFLLKQANFVTRCNVYNYFILVHSLADIRNFITD
jgi:hypothetical protein